MKTKIPFILLLAAAFSVQQMQANDQQNSSSKSNSDSQQQSSSSQTSSDQSNSAAEQSNSSAATSQGSPAEYQAGQSGQRGTPVQFNSLPQPVQKTLRAEAGGLNIENVKKMTKQGQTCYQATFDKGAMKGKVTVGEDGSLMQSQLAEDLALVAAIPAINQSGEQLNSLPEPVQQTIKQAAGSNEVGNISKDSQSGKTVYHAAFNDAGVHTDLFVNEQGKLIARSDETALFTAPIQNTQSLSLNSAPEAVQKAVREKASSSGQISDIDKGTWNGRTAYRVMVEKNGSSRPLIISESGDILGSQGQTSSGAPASSESRSSSQKNTDQQSQDNQSPQSNPQSQNNQSDNSSTGK
ncbi:MAG: hypothetical protein ACTHMT_14305 [Verrucomicrobiota bacterium]